MTLTSCSDDDAPEVIIETKVLFTSNNSDGNVNMYTVTDLNSVSKATLTTPATASDGVYYDSNDDLVVQASRSTFGLEGYANISTFNASATVAASISGSLDMQSPREIAVMGSMYVVADSADADGHPSTKDGRLFVYTNNAGNFTLRNVITTDFKVWGITFIGNDLYAIVDTTNQLAVYTNFLSNTSNATLAASKTIIVEGIVRTHGLTYDTSSDIMILTDIGEASNGQDDGGFHIINNFASVFGGTSNGGTLALSDQIRVSGTNTLLGNPVDVAYDGDSKTVFIAEAGNGGGRILAFNDISSGGNLTPKYNADLASASAVYLHKE